MAQPTINRREFLQASALAAAGPPSHPKIRTALLTVEHGHLNGKIAAMRNSGEYELVCAHEPDDAVRRLREGQEWFAGIKWVREDELLNDPSIDLVFVESRAVPDLVRYARKAILAGKHVHIEKPPSSQMEPFRELIEEARRRKRLLQVGYMWRFHETLNAALEAARAGLLGHVYMLRGTINTDLSDRDRAPLARYRGGMMFELGCHLVDRVVDLWGRPSAVRSWLRKDGGKSDGLADNTLAVFEYEASLAVVTSSAAMPGHTQHRSFELIGTEGVALIQPVEPGTTLRLCLREARGPYRKGWQNIPFPAQPRFMGDMKELAAAINGRRPLRYSYDFELLVHETMLRASGELPA